MIKADILFYNGNIYSTPFKKFIKGYFSIKDDKILHLGQGDVPEDVEYEKSIDLAGKWVIPGLIDSHMHVESSMIAPRPFAKLMVENGVTTVVSEPHEIANVTGLDGVVAMIEATKGAVMDVYYAIPSSVPSTDLNTETTGAVIDMPELIELIKHPEVICLGEVMNTNKVLTDPDDKQVKFVNYLKEHRPDMPLEGHVPRIVGSQLNQYVYTGISSDHTDHDLDEFLQRVFNGVYYQIQDITAKPEIAKAIEEYKLYENVGIVTDDTTPAHLVNRGHLNAVIMKMVGYGLKFENAIYCSTATPAKRMRLYDRGQLMPGLLADFCILDTIDTIKPVQTYKRGQLVFDRSEGTHFDTEKAFPDSFYKTMKIDYLTADMFDIKVNSDKDTVNMNGIKVQSENTRTPKLEREVNVCDGKIVLPDDLNKLIVFERHGHNGNICGTIAGGACVVKGAVATSYAHDHHNLVVLGSNNDDMALAANAVIKNGGGLAVASDGKIIAECQLEVCGLISERNPYDVANDIENVEKAMKEIGYNHYDPIMSFATTCLPVSMEYKLTDIGLVDVPNGRFVPIFTE